MTPQEELLKIILIRLDEAKRPAEQVLWDDFQLRENLHMSARTTASLREKRVIQYSKIGGKIYYRLSDVLALIEKNSVPAISDKIRIKF